MAAGIFRLVRLASFVNLRPRAEEGVDSLIRIISASRPAGLAFFLHLRKDQLNLVCGTCALSTSAADVLRDRVIDMGPLQLFCQ